MRRARAPQADGRRGHTEHQQAEGPSSLPLRTEQQNTRESHTRKHGAQSLGDERPFPW